VQEPSGLRDRATPCADDRPPAAGAVIVTLSTTIWRLTWKMADGCRRSCVGLGPGDRRIEGVGRVLLAEGRRRTPALRRSFGRQAAGRPARSHQVDHVPGRVGGLGTVSRICRGVEGDPSMTAARHRSASAERLVTGSARASTPGFGSAFGRWRTDHAYASTWTSGQRPGIPAIGREGDGA